MKRKVTLVAALAISSLPVFAQDQPQITPRVMPTAKESRLDQPTEPESFQPLTVKAGTKIPLALKQGISTHSARVRRSGGRQLSLLSITTLSLFLREPSFKAPFAVLCVREVKGRAELQMTFTSMIFPSGYTVVLPGAVEGVPGSNDSAIKDSEGTIQQSGSKGKDAQTIASRPYRALRLAHLLTAARERELAPELAELWDWLRFC